MSDPDAIGVDRALALIRDRFLNRVDQVAILAPWGKPCPASCNGSLDALLRSHLLGRAAEEIEIACHTSKGTVTLKGQFRVGAYAPGADGTTRWQCIDLDGGNHRSGLIDSEAAALEAYRRTLDLRLPAYLERSGSGAGWHLWIFFDPPIPADKARALGLALVPSGHPLHAGGISDPSAGRGVEVFPKQARLRNGGHGNLVWLPWWAGATLGCNCFYRISGSGDLEPFAPTVIVTTSPDEIDRALRELGSAEGRSKRPGRGEENDSVWPQWRKQALAALPLESIYGAWLTGRTSGDGWLECRDASSLTGDQNPSAGVAVGTGEVERGSFHSFLTGRTVSVFDFLIERNLARGFRDACAKVAELSTVPLPQRVSLPGITITNKQLRDTVHEAWNAVHAANHGPELFQRSQTLVRIVLAEGTPRIDLMPEDAVYGQLARVANWLKVKQEGPVPAHPDRDTAKDMMVNPDSALPYLERITFAPVFAPNGDLLLDSGYHRDARLWIQLAAGMEVPAVPERPSDEDLAIARNLLLVDLLGDFPFTADSDRSHAIAALILQFVRDLVRGPTPIHLIESPTPGSGKGLLADVISLLFVGRVCQPTTIARDEDESRKKITALLVRAQSVNLVDNVRGALESSQIAAAITADIWSDRILGQSRMIDLPNRATWLFTGNNPRLSLEIARRCLRIRLDPKVDRPWQRTGFRHPQLREWIREQRARLIWAVLVLVRYWMAAGRPHGDCTLGSFESYAAVLGGILGAAGISGFLSDTEQLYEQADAEGQEWRELTSAWWETHGRAWISASDLHSLAVEKELLPQVLGDGNERSQRIRLGKALQTVRDRQFGSLRVLSEQNRGTGAARYRLVNSDEPNPAQQAALAGSDASPDRGGPPDNVFDLAHLQEPDGA